MDREERMVKLATTRGMLDADLIFKDALASKELQKSKDAPIFREKIFEASNKVMEVVSRILEEVSKAQDEELEELLGGKKNGETGNDSERC